MEKKFILIAFLLVSCEDKLNWVKIPIVAPIVYSIDPDTGTSGTMVTITGANFNTTSSGNSVMIHETSATVVEASHSVLKFIAPDETTGPVIVTVNHQVAENNPVFIYK